MTNTTDEKIIYKDLSYKLQGLAFKIRNELGSGHKESIYQKALENELKNIGINFKREPAIKIYSLKGDFLGLYRPDFLIDGKIIIELKAAQFVTRQENARVYDYLRNSEYELAYLINFASPRLFIKRLIFTNDRKPQIPTNVKRIATNMIGLLVFVAISVLFVGIRGVGAAQIKFETPVTTAAVGDTIVLRVRLNTEGASINAVDLGILYPKILSVKNISKSGSFIQIWVKEPSYTSDVIFLSGGVPGGIISGNTIIGTVTFEAKSVGDGALGLSPASSVLLNDGSGTSVPTSLQTPTIHVVPRKANQTPKVTPKVLNEDVSVKQVKSDFIRPNGFDLLIGSDVGVFAGKYFISFFTTDSGSGMDHYQLKEGDGPYVSARSPYLLSDQTLHSVIHVRAYDVAGNYREEVYPNLFIRIWWAILRIFHR